MFPDWFACNFFHLILFPSTHTLTPLVLSIFFLGLGTWYYIAINALPVWNWMLSKVATSVVELWSRFVLDQFVQVTFPFTQWKNCLYSIASLDGTEAQDIFWRNQCCTWVDKVMWLKKTNFVQNSWHSSVWNASLVMQFIIKRTLSHLN